MSKATDKARAALDADMDRWRADARERAGVRLGIIRSALSMLQQVAPRLVKDRHLDGDAGDMAMATMLESSGVMIDTDELLEIIALAARQFELPR
jgi:hypothetical protein